MKKSSEIWRLLIMFVAVICLATAGCSGDTDNLDPESVNGSITINGNSYLLQDSARVKDLQLNVDGSYRMLITLSFGTDSILSFQLNSQLDRAFNQDSYSLSDSAQNGTVSGVLLSYGEMVGPEDPSFSSGSVLIASVGELFMIDFNLDGEYLIQGSFTGAVVFPERLSKGFGSFAIDGVDYEIPFFSLASVIKIDNGSYPARLYFYDLDPLNVYFNDERRHSFYFTVVQGTDEKLIPGTYRFGSQSVPFALIDSQPISLAEDLTFFPSGFTLIGGVVAIEEELSGDYSLQFTLNFSDGNGSKSIIGNYQGPINGW